MINKTIKEVSTGIYKEKGSKFIGYAYPVKSEEEVQQILKLLKKEHHSARHHCYAYAIGINREKIRYSDDGEPHGTAGKPIYNQILSFNLTNVLIVVVRYFGGILLGTGGLTHAYKTAAFEALKNAVIIELKNYLEYTITCNFENISNILKILNNKEYKCKILKQGYEESYNVINIIIPEDKKEIVLKKLLDIPEIKLEFVQNFLM